MSEHTPGPWKARKVGGVGFPGQIGYAIDFNEDQEQVVDFVYEEADAHLISSAPDLLEALERLVSDFESEIHNEYDGTRMLSARLAECDYARAAIAKARGEA